MGHSSTDADDPRFDLFPDEAKALKGVELKYMKQRLVMFERVI